MANNSNRSMWISLGMAAGAALAARQVVRMKRAADWQTRFQNSPKGTAMVTGASSGIGAEYARRLAELGFDMVLVARRVERLEALAEELRKAYEVQAEVLPADLSNSRDLSTVEKRLKQGDITYLVNNAGFGIPGSFDDLHADLIQDEIRVHILASVRLTKAALPAMLERGSGVVVNVSSVASFMAVPGDAIYGPTKTFLNQFSESLGLTVAPHGVKIQALCPGFTTTEFHFTKNYEGIDVHTATPSWAWLTTRQVVDDSIKSLGTGDFFCIPGWHYQIVALLGRTGFLQMIINLLSNLSPELVLRLRGHKKNIPEGSSQTRVE